MPNQKWESCFFQLWHLSSKTAAEKHDILCIFSYISFTFKINWSNEWQARIHESVALSSRALKTRPFSTSISTDCRAELMYKYFVESAP